MGLVATPLLGEVTPIQPALTNHQDGEPSASQPNSQGPTTPPQAIPPAGYRVNFVDVSAAEVVRFIGRQAGLNVIFNERELTFPITLVAHEQTPINELMAALSQVLRTHNLNLTQQGNNLIISTAPTGQTLASVVSEELHNVNTTPAGSVTRVFRLKNNSPTNVMPLVKALLSPQAVVQPSEQTGQLIVTDLSANVSRVEQLLASLDSSSSPLEINLFQPTYGDMASLMGLTERIMQPIAAGTPLVMVPQESTNTIYLVSTPFLVERSLAVLHALDVPSALSANLGAAAGTPGADLSSVASRAELPKEHLERTEFSIHKLAYQKGDSIERALRETAVALEKSGDVNHDLICAIRSVKWVENNNTLVFTGTPEALVKVGKLVSDLDVPLRQVYIEMLIVQTDLSDSLTFGVDWAIDGKNLINGNLNTASGFDPNKTGIISQVAGVTATSPLPDPANSFNPVDFGLGVIGRAIHKGGSAFVTMGSLIQALATDSETKILLTPRILAQDNTTATLFVGQNIPYQTTVITSTASTNFQGTLDYRDVGTTLQITPLIGQGDIVTLEVAQTVATVTNSTTVVQSGSGSSFSVIAPTTNTTTTTTRLHVPDGYFVIMSGMVTDNQVRAESRIPCLGSIPWLGYLFTKTDNSDSKKDTMIFIRPRIIQSVDELLRVTDDAREEVTSAYESGILLPQLEQTLEVLGPPPPPYCCP
jgi:type III secretion protein C